MELLGRLDRKDSEVRKASVETQAESENLGPRELMVRLERREILDSVEAKDHPALLASLVRRVVEDRMVSKDLQELLDFRDLLAQKVSHSQHFTIDSFT